MEPTEKTLQKIEDEGKIPVAERKPGVRWVYVDA
jgi:hypothetical protein